MVFSTIGPCTKVLIRIMANDSMNAANLTSLKSRKWSSWGKHSNLGNRGRVGRNSVKVSLMYSRPVFTINDRLIILMSAKNLRMKLLVCTDLSSIRTCNRKRIRAANLQTCQHLNIVKREVSPLSGEKIFRTFFIREYNTQVLTHSSCHMDMESEYLAVNRSSHMAILLNNITICDDRFRH
jgi:hypothetical protein